MSKVVIFLAVFAVIIVGTLIYMGIIELPGSDDKKDKDEEEEEEEDEDEDEDEDEEEEEEEDKKVKKDKIPKRLFNIPDKSALEFGGMYGEVPNVVGGKVNNPITNKMECPPGGFKASKFLWSRNIDYPTTYCYREITNPEKWKPRPGSMEFGGIYGKGIKDGQDILYNNHMTGGQSCHPDFTSQQIRGAPDVDHPLYYCYKEIENIDDENEMAKWKPSEGSTQFGGMYGHADHLGGDVPNPITGENKCPSGFFPTKVSQADNVDHPSFYCSRSW